MLGACQRTTEQTISDTFICVPEMGSYAVLCARMLLRSDQTELQPDPGKSGRAMTAQVDHDTCVRLASRGGTPRHQHGGRWNSYGVAASRRLSVV